jgi:hypothetical protein
MHESEPPEEIALTTDDRPKTFTGVVLDVLVPSPSSTLPLLPQHFAPPASKVAQACKFPTLTDFTPELRPLTAVGVLRLVVVPSPIWPSSFLPQHLSAPLVRTAQDEPDPIEIDETPDVKPDTETGEVRVVVVPSPNCP